MSDELIKTLRAVIKEELQPIKEQLVRLESKLDATFEQVVKISENHTDLVKDINTHEHHFNIIDKQLVRHAIEIDKLKNR